MSITLRDYQEEAIKAWFSAWEKQKIDHLSRKRFLRPLLHLATGAGKTVIFTEGVKRIFQANPMRVVLLAHTQELIFQMYGKFQEMWKDMPETISGKPTLGIEMADFSMSNAWIVVATRQTLVNRLEKILSHGVIDVLIIDECHHVSPDNSYQKIIDTFHEANSNLRVAGFTATPERSDQLALLANFDEIVFTANVELLMAQKYLVPAHRIVRGINVSLETVATYDDDYSLKDLIAKLDQANWVAHAEEAYFELVHGKRKKTLAFFPSVEMSKDFAKRLSKNSVNVHHVDAHTSAEDRKRYLDDFRYGNCSVLTNVLVLTEGVDLPMTDCIFNMRPTKSSTLYTQIVGRGLRPSLDTDKEDLLIVELSGKTDVLLFGDLVGKVRTCNHCKTKYWLGYKKCPNCGNVSYSEEKLEQEEKAALQLKTWQTMYEAAIGTYTKELFKKSRVNWHSDNQGRLSVGAGTNRSYVILPPTGFDITKSVEITLSYKQNHASVSRDEYERHAFFIERALNYSLFCITKEGLTKGKRCVMLKSANTLEELMKIAESDASKVGGVLSNKRASWMKGKATEKQIRLLKALRVQLPESGGLTAGQAAKLITHKFALDEVKAYVLSHYPKGIHK